MYLIVFKVGERIRVILDCDDNTLAFERNCEFLGVAFRGKTLEIGGYYVKMPRIKIKETTFFFFGSRGET